MPNSYHSIKDYYERIIQKESKTQAIKKPLFERKPSGLEKLFRLIEKRVPELNKLEKGLRFNITCSIAEVIQDAEEKCYYDKSNKYEYFGEAADYLVGNNADAFVKDEIIQRLSRLAENVFEPSLKDFHWGEKHDNGKYKYKPINECRASLLRNPTKTKKAKSKINWKVLSESSFETETNFAAGKNKKVIYLTKNGIIKSSMLDELPPGTVLDAEDIYKLSNDFGYSFIYVKDSE